MKTKRGGKGGKFRPTRLLGKFWQHSFWHKWLLIITALAVFLLGVSYGIAQWYIQKHSNEPLTIGATFIPDYAESYGLDPHHTLNAIFSDLGMRQVRLVSYWNDIEPQPGHYDFSQLDWQFAMANKYHAKVSLAIGLRQPRWPECHEPDWVNMTDKSQWQPQLYKYMNAVIDRYKNNPALQSYQLENEFFMKVFGKCTDFNRYRLTYEFNMVKKADSGHPIIISRSNNWVGIPINKPTPDEFSVSVYKRVWDSTITHRYFEYPQPAWTYATLAGSEEIWSGRDMIIHELQAEPWPPHGQGITETSLDEQFKSMNAERLKDRISYAEGTGMRSMDIWGIEWMYWLKENKGHPEVWNVAKQSVEQANQENQNLDN
jgi:hypothetical protein